MRSCPGLVLEYVKGSTLGHILHEKKEKLSRPRIVQLMRDVAAGIECVHANGFYHLDLKSDNVLVDERKGVAKLSDFGSCREERTQVGSLPSCVADPATSSSSPCDTAPSY
jgi:serine/threonine protein kinase